METVEFFFDYSCPYAYLASTQIEALCARVGATLRWRPMLLGGVFNALGHSYVADGGPTERDRRRLHHNQVDLARFAELWEVPLSWPSSHPMRTVTALRATLALPESDWPRAIHALYRAYWVEGRDVASDVVVQQVLEEAGLPGGEALAAINDDVKARLRRDTEEAVARGVFGAPAIFARGELYWGQDRLWMVEEALGGRPTQPGEGRFHSPTAGVNLPFYFDFASPFAYLASTRVEAIARAHGARLEWRPLLLGGLFRALDGPMVPLFTFSAPKQQYYLHDVDRWARWWGVPLSWPSTFPMNTVKALRVALSLGEGMGPFVHRAMRAAWAEDRDLSDEGVLADLLGEVGEDRARAQAGGDARLKQMLIDATQAACDAGVFGVPTFSVGHARVWGQDRLFLVERLLEGWRPSQ